MEQLKQIDELSEAELRKELVHSNELTAVLSQENGMLNTKLISLELQFKRLRTEKELIQQQMLDYIEQKEPAVKPGRKG